MTDFEKFKKKEREQGITSATTGRQRREMAVAVAQETNAGDTAGLAPAPLYVEGTEKYRRPKTIIFKKKWN